MAAKPTVIECPNCGHAIPLPRRTWRGGNLSRWVWRCSWTYLALVVLVAAMMHGLSESWTLNTLLIFGPRWVWALPLVVLIPAAVLTRLAALAPVVGAVAVGLMLISGFVVPVRRGDSPVKGTIRIATCNTA